MREEVLAELRRDEGLKLNAYQDSKKIWTIGYGTNLQSLTIDVEQAEVWLNEMYEDAVDQAKTLTNYCDLSPVRRSVVVSMVYQMGLTGVRKFHRFWDAIDREDYQEAYVELLDSQWAKYDSPARARRMARRFRDDSWL